MTQRGAAPPQGAEALPHRHDSAAGATAQVDAEAPLAGPDAAVRRRLSQLLRASPAVIYSFKAAGDFAPTFVSDNIMEVFGYAPDEYLDNPSFWRERVHAEDLGPVERAVARLFHDDMQSVEYRFRCKDGSYAWVNDQQHLIRGGDGKPIEIVGSWSDISARKAAEAAEAAAHARVNHLLESSPSAIYSYKASGDFAHIFVSQNIRELLGYEPQEYLEQPDFWRSRIHPDDLAAVEAGTAQLFRKGRNTLEYRFLRHDGTYCWLNDAQQLIRDGEGRPTEVVGSWSDATERKRAEQEAAAAMEQAQLFEAEQQRTRDLTELLEQQTAIAEVLRVISGSPGDLAPVFDAILLHAVRSCGAHNATFWLGDENGLRRAARHAERSAAAKEVPIRPSAESGLGRVLATRLPIHLDDYRADGAYLSGDPFVVAAVDKLGIRTSLDLPMIKENRLVGAMSLYRTDVRPFTEKQIEFALTLARQAGLAVEQARLVNELRAKTDELANSLQDLHTAQDRLVQTEKLASLGQLTAGIAHEIKNPLNFVTNFSSISAELIEELQDVLEAIQVDGETKAEINELVGMLRGNFEKVVQHGKRADSIIRNMLLHSRQGSSEHHAADINAIVEESLNLAYHGARAERQGFNITLERSFDSAAGKVDVFAQEITRVLLNLISNGFYATVKRKAQAGGSGYEPTLAATTRNLGDKVEIRIRDNGTGIPTEVKDKIFNPFFTTKPAGEGTGLGLSLSYDIIVKQHAGTIEVDTQPGEFTEFRITLPRGGAAVGTPGGQT